MRARDGYKDPARLTRWTIRTAIAVAVAGLAMTVGMWRYPVPGDGTMDALHWLLALASAVYLAALLAGIVLGLAWTFRVAWNARHLGARGFDATPAMAVGWYFVPFANLVMPYRALRQVYSASLDPAGWDDGHRPVVAAWWWLLLLSGVLSRIGGLTGEAFNAFDVGGMLLAAAAAGAFVRLATRVAAAQAAHHARGSAAMPAPPAAA